MPNIQQYKIKYNEYDGGCLFQFLAYFGDVYAGLYSVVQPY